MKKIKLVVVLLFVSLFFTACSEPQQVFVGTYEGHAVEITPPTNWVMTSYDMGVSFTPLSQTNMLSTITVQEHTNQIVEDMILNEEEVKQMVIDEINAMSEDETYVDFKTFEVRTFGENSGIYVLVTYQYSGHEMKQEQLIFDTSYGAASITFSTVGDEDMDELFDEVIEELVIK